MVINKEATTQKDTWSHLQEKKTSAGAPKRSRCFATMDLRLFPEATWWYYRFGLVPEANCWVDNRAELFVSEKKLTKPDETS